MKYLFIAISLLKCFSVYAQDAVLPLNKDSVVEYQQVVHLKDSLKTKNEIYNLTTNWFSSTFKKHQLFMFLSESKDQLTVKLTGLSTHTNTGWGTYVYDFAFTTEILIKNGRYKYRINDIRCEAFGGGAGDAEGGKEISGFYRRYLHGNPKKFTIGKKKNMDLNGRYFAAIDKQIKDYMSALEAILNSSNNTKQDGKKMSNDF